MTTTGLSPNRKLPYRRLFAEEELQAVQQVFEHSWKEERDFGYQGPFEQAYCNAFAHFQGGGYADGVGSGTASVLLALLALDLPKGSEVILSPVTDPGGVNPVIFAGMRPVIADSAPGQFNVDLESFKRAITPTTRAAILTHSGGIPIDIEPIIRYAKEQQIEIIEDCSQAHGAELDGRKVGTFGRIGCFSTMFSKHHASGGCGGIVYTKEAELYHKLLALADRGKETSRIDFHPKDPDTFLFPALNFNMDELSAAIGHSTLRKLPETLERRRELLKFLPKEGLTPIKTPAGAKVSPFFHTLRVDPTVDKQELVLRLQNWGVPVNGDYRYLPSEWHWLKTYIGRPAVTPNSKAARDSSINILYHERFSDQDMQWVGDVLKEQVAALKGSRSHRGRAPLPAPSLAG